MKEYEQENVNTGLEFKVHNMRFDSLSEEIDMIGKLLIESRNTFKRTFYYLECLESLYIRYSGYLHEPQKQEDIIKNVRISLYNNKYLNVIKDFDNSINKEIPVGIINHNNKAVDRLNAVFRIMIINFIDFELLPKPHITPKRESELETDERKKIKLLAQEFLEM